jgi:hypothetical protein
MSKNEDAFKWQEKLKQDYPKLLKRIAYFEHNSGWEKLLRNLFDGIVGYEKIAKSDYIPVYFVQIKEKFGTLRAYFEGGDEEVIKMVDEAEGISGQTCEVCGKLETSKIRSHKGWFYTSCDEHAKGNANDNDK